MKYNSQNYIEKIAESKLLYHKKQANLPYEEKVKILVELQKIDMEMMKNNKQRIKQDRYRRLWVITE